MRNQYLGEVENFELYSNLNKFETPNLEWATEGRESEINRNNREYIRWAQRALNQNMGLRLAEDGIVGAQTRSAIRSFQQRSGLQVDGILGPRTAAALIAAGAPAQPGTSSGSSPSVSTDLERVCPEPARLARDRCLHPGTQQCPAIPNLLCVSGVESVPFEYPNWKQIQKDPRTGLYIVRDRQRNRQQRFIPSVRDALRSFIRNMQRFGMPIEAIITGGSLYCRCITNSDHLSNHSFGDAIDIVGLRWPAVGGPASKLSETIVHNYQDAGERTLLRRTNACLRLSFATVIDYHRPDHRDHFHCDMNRGRGRPVKGQTTVSFVQESLNVVFGRNLSENGRLERETVQALSDFSGHGTAELRNESLLNQVYDDLFTRVAHG
jgi:Uncharacterized protein conserved in bacteria